jgi:hypothetical protein
MGRRILDDRDAVEPAAVREEGPVRLLATDQVHTLTRHAREVLGARIRTLKLGRDRLTIP